MTIFKSRQVNLDPEPWYAPSGWNGEPAARFAVQSDADAYGRNEYDPRPEFEPTRDPLPWLCIDGTRVWKAEFAAMGPTERYWYEWAPRREQFDTPVNPILDAARVWGVKTGNPRWALRCFLDGVTEDEFCPEAHREIVRAATPEQIDHARRVLTRLRSHDILTWAEVERAEAASDYKPLPIHRTEAGYPNCPTCDGGGCLDCTDPAN